MKHLAIVTIKKLYLDLLDRLRTGKVPVVSSQLLLLFILDGDGEKSCTVPGVVLRHVWAAGVPFGDVGVLTVNLGTTRTKRPVQDGWISVLPQQ